MTAVIFGAVRDPDGHPVVGARIVYASAPVAMPDIAASTGSACHSGGTEPSPVLAAMGVPREVGAGAIRLSLGRTTTREELEALVERLTKVLSDGGGS